MIYLDHNATSPIRPDAVRAMNRVYNLYHIGNASSLHAAGAGARALVESARVDIADCVNAQPEEIIFTSGGTESNNLAVKGAAAIPPRVRRLAARGTGDPVAGIDHMVTSKMEHTAVLSAVREVRNQSRDHDYTVSILDPDYFGLLHVEPVFVRPNTVLVSIIHANNEVGTIQHIEKLRFHVRAFAPGALFHTDAVQSFGKVPLDVKELGVDLMSLSAHKLGGPKGVGALYIKSGTEIMPQMHGGHQERGIRPGTENVAGIVGFAAAAKFAVNAMDLESPRLWLLADRMITEISKISAAFHNGHKLKRLPNTVNFSFAGLDGETLVMLLDQAGFCVSTGAACSAGSLKPSHVLLAMGKGDLFASAAVRFSLGWTTTEKDIDLLLKALPNIVAEARKGYNAKSERNAEAKGEQARLPGGL